MPPLPSQVRSQSRGAVPPPVQQGQRIAVNLLDLDRVEPLVRQMLLGGKLDLSEVVRVGSASENALDEMGVAFSCDLLTACCCCDTLRNRDKSRKQYPTRVYIFRERAWTRVVGNTTLAVVEDKELLPNPAVFRRDVEPAEPVPLRPKRLQRP